VDNDPAKVETLKEQNLNAMLGNIGDDKLLEQIVVDNLESVFIVSSDINANKRALDYMVKNAPDVQVVVRAQEYKQKEEMEAAGADLVVLPSNLPQKAVAFAIIQYIERIKSVKLAQSLKKIISNVGEGKLAIIVHNSPDPDAISSGMALKEIANSVGVKSLFPTNLSLIVEILSQPI